MKTVRMADIARELGISVVTVSNGLSGRSGVSEEMRERILRTAESMGYGRPTTGKLRKNFGILCADAFFRENSFYVNLYRALSQESFRRGYSTLLELITSETESTCRLPLLVTDQKVDGLFFMGELSDGYLKTVLDCGLPSVLLDFYAQAADRLNTVRSDNVQSGCLLTQHLLDCGRKQIGFVGSIAAAASMMDRYLGYEKALLRAGVTPRREWRIEDRDEQGEYIPLVLPEEMPEAFVCGSDEGAFRLIQTLKDRGIRIPEDTSVVSCDDSSYARLCVPAITAYRVDVESMAAVAVRRILETMQDRSSWHGVSVISGTLQVRESSVRKA